MCFPSFFYGYFTHQEQSTQPIQSKSVYYKLKIILIVVQNSIISKYNIIEIKFNSSILSLKTNIFRALW